MYVLVLIGILLVAEAFVHTVRPAKMWGAGPGVVAPSMAQTSLMYKTYVKTGGACATWKLAGRGRQL
jgi:hypothetical protein